MRDLITVDTSYDIAGITSLAKRRLAVNILLASLYFIMIVASVFFIILYNDIWWVFLLATLAVVIALFLLLARLNTIKYSYYTTAYGEIADIFKDISVHDPIKGSGIGSGLGYGAGLGGKPRYNKYRISSSRLTIYIKKGDLVRFYQINGVTPKHEEYYESRGEAIHIFGTRFPIKPESAEEWLCPFCGEFNSKDEKACIHCHKHILK